MRRFFLFAFFSLFGFFFAPSVSAFSLTPAISDLSLSPGDKYQGTIHVVNDEPITRTYYLSIQKFIPQGESGQQLFLPLSETRGLPSWIYFDRPFITLRADEEQTVSFGIRVPYDAPPGGHYAAIFFSTEPPIQKSLGKIVTGSKTGSLVLLTIEGNLVRKVGLKEFVRESPETQSSLPVSFQAIVENQGGTHVVPQGELVIKSFFGTVAERINLNSEGSRVLPGSSRRFSLVWQSANPRVGSGFWHSVVQEWRNFGFGKYTATFQLTGVGAEDAAPVSVVFFIWPWHLILVGLFLAFLLGVLIRLYKHWVIYRATVK